MGREPLVKLEYRKGQDGMLYPDLRISKDREMDGGQPRLFGRKWKDYMKEYHPLRLSLLTAEGRINRMVCEVDREAEEKKEKVIQSLLQVQPMQAPLPISSVFPQIFRGGSGVDVKA